MRRLGKTAIAAVAMASVAFSVEAASMARGVSAPDAGARAQTSPTASGLDTGHPEPDPDADRVGRDDNCPGIPNPHQSDLDHDGAGDACDPIATTLKVFAVVADSFGRKTGANVTLSARLTTVTGRPLPGYKITFSTPASPICSAFTEATGVAACHGTVAGSIAVVFRGLKYTAAFDGSWPYLYSYGDAPVVRWRSREAL
jgi:hypothetical protein